MKTNLSSASSTPAKEPLPSIRKALKLIGMKEVATNVFSLPQKNKV